MNSTTPKKEETPKKNKTALEEDESDEKLQKKYYEQDAVKNLKTQQDQIQKTIALLKKKYSNIDDELKNADARNPNLNDINFNLLNTTNHLVIDLSLSRDQ